MNKYFIKYFFFTISFYALIASSACGVKGKPLPPETTPYIGSGEKVYSAVTTTTTIPALNKNQKLNKQIDQQNIQQSPSVKPDMLNGQ